MIALVARPTLVVLLALLELNHRRRSQTSPHTQRITFTSKV